MAIQVNASDIHLRSSKALGLSSQSPFSVTCWVNCVWNPGSRRSFVGIYGPATDTPLATPVTAGQLGTSAGNGDLTCWTWGGGTLVATPAGSMTQYNNLWVFLSYSYDGTTHRLYVNGVQQATSTTAQQPGYLNQIYISGYPGGGTNETAAFKISQYALFRRALLPNEILTIYSAAGARHGVTNESIGLFKFDELSEGSTISSVADLSGSDLSLSAVGAGSPMTYSYINTYANSNVRPVQ